MTGDTLADALNRSCHCINVDRDALQETLEARFGKRGAYARLRESHPNLLADAPVFVSRNHIARMQAVIDAVEQLVALPRYRNTVLDWAPDIARAAPGAYGVFFGYDFHLTKDGPRLIEINTNAGGALLLLHLAGAQQACCAEVEQFIVGAVDLGNVEDTFVRMFRDELDAVRPGTELRRIAIVDENPQAQYLSPEFELFRELFATQGIDALIAGPADLHFTDGRLLAGDRVVDLVYNRLTDFYLQAQASRSLGEACRNGYAVFTPGPGAHALYANKRNLTLLCNPHALRQTGAGDEMVDILSQATPRTELVGPDNADELWARRKQLYFKPACGFGSRGTYKGAKLTKKTWASILETNYVAQELVPPSERLLVADGEQRAMKVDIRCFVYRGEIQLLGARMYRGQTTNFRTDGGGLAAVFTTPFR